MEKGEKVGYVRVSSFDQNPERQLENIELDKIYTDKAVLVQKLKNSNF